ncbi:MAG: hypothetical protein U5L45_21610 [Saprospiraceae bacterium]|nr:hypothetical protein [Saprospiraceae bacterium]
MFKNSLLFVLLLTATQQLFAQKKAPYKYRVHQIDFVSSVTKSLNTTNNVENNDLAASNSSNSGSTNKTLNPNLSKKRTQLATQLDSVWLKTGETLTGQIFFEKDSNAFIFSQDTFQDIRLKAGDVIKLVALPKKITDERLTVISLADEFYFLESESKVTIQLYANHTFKPILDDGPKLYMVQSKYCLIKNGVPYLIKSGKSKDILMDLMNDCKKVMDNFRTGKFTEEDIIEAVIQYNRCYE